MMTNFPQSEQMEEWESKMQARHFFVYFNTRSDIEWKGESVNLIHAQGKEISLEHDCQEMGIVGKHFTGFLP